VAGTLVGRYELEVPLGSGAMGEVWRGRDLATRQPVAVKLVQLANIDNQAVVAATAVSVTNPDKIGCNSTVNVVGTIFTNGNGGPITYQWTKDGENLPTGTVTASSGKQQVLVDLKWNLRGKGTHHAAAIFQVFTPNVISAQSATFTYKCAA
jgi:serine/threonine protein kinase